MPALLLCRRLPPAPAETYFNVEVARTWRDDDALLHGHEGSVGFTDRHRHRNAAEAISEHLVAPLHHDADRRVEAAGRAGRPDQRASLDTDLDHDRTVGLTDALARHIGNSELAAQ